MENNVFILDLSATLEYSKKGEFEKTASLEFAPPSMLCEKEAMRLAQLVMRATIDAKDLAAGQEQQKADQSVDEEAVKILLMSSKSVPFSDVSEAFKALACKVCTCDGELKVTEALLAKLSLADYMRALTGYVANFTFPSLFSGEGMNKG